MLMMTRWGGYYLLREDQLGSLEPGKMADLVVLDKNPLDSSVPDEGLSDIQVLGREREVIPLELETHRAGLVRRQQPHTLQRGQQGGSGVAGPCGRKSKSQPSCACVTWLMYSWP